MTRREELRELGVLAVPLIGTQIASVALPWTDALVLARIGSVELAGGGLGATVLSTASILMSCFLGALSAMIARARAERRDDDARMLLEQARVLAIALGAPCALGACFAAPLLRLLGQDPAVARDAGAYLLGAAPAFLTMPLATVQRHAFAALRRPAMVTAVWACAVPLNVALDVVLAFGLGPFPELGVLGVGLATSVVSILIVLALELALRRWQRELAGAILARPVARVLQSILGLGVPIAIAVGAEVGVFSAAAIAVGWIGAGALAAHHVAIQTTQLLFLAPNGWSQATAIRVASKAVHAPRVALGVAAFVSSSIAVALALVRDDLAALYFGAGATGQAAAKLLLCVAAFHVADALQVVSAGILRGRGDTKTAMRWGMIAYCGVAPIVGLGAAFWLELGVFGVWLGLASGLWLAAIALVRRAV